MIIHARPNFMVYRRQKVTHYVHIVSARGDPLNKLSYLGSFSTSSQLMHFITAHLCSTDEQAFNGLIVFLSKISELFSAMGRQRWLTPPSNVIHPKIAQSSNGGLRTEVRIANVRMPNVRQQIYVGQKYVLQMYVRYKIRMDECTSRTKVRIANIRTV